MSLTSWRVPRYADTRKVILAAEQAGKDVAQLVTEMLEQATRSTGH